MPKQRHVLLVAGDPSADRHAAALVQALKRLDPTLRVSALGGKELQKAADRFIFPLVDVGGFGFWEPLLKLPTFWKVLQTIKTLFKEDPPDVVIPVDYYGFNIRVARAAHTAGVPVVYYISPQVWASRPKRIQELAAVVTKMLVIFPFEVDLYRKANVPVAFVGHPLLEHMPAPVEPARPLHIGLLPGSRPSVVMRHLPILIETAALLRKEFPEALFLLFRPSELDESVYQSALHAAPWIRLVTDSGYEERRRLSLAISVSGTAALENMLLGIPMVIMYRLSSLTYWIARALIRIPFIGIPNILAGKSVVPELIQDDATPERLAQASRDLLNNPVRYQKMRQDLLHLRENLQPGGVPQAAEEILKNLIEYCP